MSKNKLSKFKSKRNKDIPLRKLDNARDRYWTAVADEYLKLSGNNPFLDKIFNT